MLNAEQEYTRTTAKVSFGKHRPTRWLESAQEDGSKARKATRTWQPDESAQGCQNMAARSFSHSGSHVCQNKVMFWQAWPSVQGHGSWPLRCRPWHRQAFSRQWHRRGQVDAGSQGRCGTVICTVQSQAQRDRGECTKFVQPRQYTATTWICRAPGACARERKCASVRRLAGARRQSARRVVYPRNRPGHLGAEARRLSNEAHEGRREQAACGWCLCCRLRAWSRTCSPAEPAHACRLGSSALQKMWRRPLGGQSSQLNNARFGARTLVLPPSLSFTAQR